MNGPRQVMISVVSVQRAAAWRCRCVGVAACALAASAPASLARQAAEMPCPCAAAVCSEKLAFRLRDEGLELL